MGDAESKGWIVKLPKEKKKFRLDRRDLLILQTLMENGRTTLTTLRKITRLSKASILNRISNLEKAEIIKGYSTLLNLHKCGLTMYTIAVRVKMTLRQKEEYLLHLKRTKFINQVWTFTGGRWDYLIRVYVKDSSHLDQVVTRITRFAGITSIDIFTLDEWYVHLPNYLGIKTHLSRKCARDDLSFQKTFAKRKKGGAKMDRKDVQLLRILSNNARRTLTEIGRSAGLSRDAVKYRLRNLIRKGVINCFFANVNPYILGCSGYSLHLQVYDRSKVKRIIHYLQHHQRSTGVLKYIESWNIAAALLMKNMAELKEFEEEFIGTFGEFIHKYQIVQIVEQPLYDMLPKEIAEVMGE